MDSAAPMVLECSGLRKSFDGRLAVDDVGFHIAAGEVYGLLGPNGAGKTTTMRMVCGLLSPDAGSITIAGRQAIGSLEVKRFIGYVPQDVALYLDLTARENLEFLGRLHGLGGKLLAERVEEALSLTDPADRRNDRLDSYSGGMKRRLNIAAGLLNHPKLLILDEPTVGVDPQSRYAILELHLSGTFGDETPGAAHPERMGTARLHRPGNHRRRLWNHRRTRARDRRI